MVNILMNSKFAMRLIEKFIERKFKLKYGCEVSVLIKDLDVTEMNDEVTIYIRGLGKMKSKDLPKVLKEEL